MTLYNKLKHSRNPHAKVQTMIHLTIGLNGIPRRSDNFSYMQTKLR